MSQRIATHTTARIRALAASVAIASTLMTGCGGSSQGSTPSVTKVDFPAGTTMAKIAASGKLIVGTKFDQPGWGLRDLSGNVVGLDPNVAVMIAKALGLNANQIEYTETVSANREPYIEQGKVDVAIASYSIDEERQKVVTFAGPYIELGQTLMVNKDNPKNIKSLPDLSGKTVCAMTGSDSQKLIPMLVPDAKMVSFDVPSKCQTALNSGQVDAFGSNAIIIGGLVQKDPKTQLVDFEYGGQTFGIGMKKGDIAFCQFINDTLAKAQVDGEWQKAFQPISDLLPMKASTLPAPIPCV
jgi:glutamate transport system substrate-binding protein